MPCNLAARADARVSNTTLAKLLTPQVVEATVRAFAKEQGIQGEVSVHDYGMSTGRSYNEFQVYVGEVEFSVQRNKDGTFNVFVGGGTRKAGRNQVLADALAKRLALVLGLLLQQKVKGALQQKFAVESTSTAPNGALIIRMEI